MKPSIVPSGNRNEEARVNRRYLLDKTEARRYLLDKTEARRYPLDKTGARRYPLDKTGALFPSKLHRLSISVLVLTSLCTSITLACAIAVRKGGDATIQDETALIIWDPQSQTEHFIRSARIATTGPDLGFLVPTPSIPTLHDTSGSTFTTLQSLTAAEIKVEITEEQRFRLFAPNRLLGSSSILSSQKLRTNSTPLASGVDVISQQQVGVYDASILKASDAESLRQWLVDHDYSIPDSLQEWLDIYVAQAWYITAFKLAQQEISENQRGLVVARPVRLTFKTEKPFYPYREPATVSDPTSAAADSAAPLRNDPKRLLRLFFLSDQRYTATIGDTGMTPVKTVWAGHLPDWIQGNITNAVQARSPSAEQFSIPSHLDLLTELEDHSSPRQGIDELFFTPDNDQSFMTRPPIVRNRVQVVYSPDIPLWTLVSIPLLVLGIVGFRIVRSRPENLGP